MHRHALALVVLVALTACGSSSSTPETPPGPSTDANLTSLAVSTGTLAPVFDPGTTAYTVGPGVLDAHVVLTPTASHTAATITVEGQPVSSGAPSQPVPLAFGATIVTIEVTAEDGTTKKATTIGFTRSGLTVRDAYVKASDTGVEDGFGQALAVSGDTLVVGAPYEDETATDSGAVYVFVRGETTWKQEGRLKAPTPVAYDGFGWSVGIDGDTLVVGAWREDTTAANSGAAYVFVRNGTTWSQQQILKASTPDDNDEFGTSVSVDGETIVVGAPRQDAVAAGSGAVYVFVRSGATWSEQEVLKAGTPGPGDELGTEVSLSGDTVVAGAPFEDGGGVDSGAAYVFVRSGTTWTEQQRLTASNEDAGDLFGWSVSAAGATVAVGAQQEQGNATGVGGNGADDSLTGAGAAYVFVRSGTTWTQQAYVKASNTGFGDQFGFDVSVEGDTLLVGAFRERSAATGLGGNQADDSLNVAGAAYVYTRSGSAWTWRDYVKASNTEAEDRFGYRVAHDGGTIVVSSYLEDSSASGVDGNEGDNGTTDSGAVYVYR